ncbi:MAG: TlpA family protein disulfide reductase [Phycisphaeraceae bacterium]|nr:TlpA family protein disulfide reductase [Phycisphaeraceae bacterium]
MRPTTILSNGSLILAAVSTVCATTLALAAGDPEAATTTLTLAPRPLDMVGSREHSMMYMPSSVTLVAERPAAVRKEPAFRGKPLYATVNIGTGEGSARVIAIDEPAGADARIYIDLNGNGDLSDDGDGAWPTVTPGKDGGSPQFSGTWVFDVTWKSPGTEPVKGRYGLNFYRSPDRDTLNYYRSSWTEGKIRLDGKDYDVRLIENDNDGRFNKLYDPSSPLSPEHLPKPVWLILGGDRFDIRGTFGFNGFNYVARVSDDGSKLTIEPTMRQIRLPQPAARPTALGVGVEAPDFEANWLTASHSADANVDTFKLSDFRGKKIVVLDLWATWCGPCMAGLPHLSEIAKAVKGQDVEVIALNVLDDKAAYDRFATEKSGQYSFRVARDPAGRDRELSIASTLFRVSGIPQTYVIDKSGKITCAVSGYQQGDRRIEQALVNLGITIDGLKPQTPEPTTEAPIKMIPATGMK